MYESIKACMDAGEWEEAEKELCREMEQELNDELCILAAAIYLNTERQKEAYDAITAGLLYNYKNYELYLLLGNYYESTNINQAWLCYENAEFYCDNEEDKKIIEQYRKQAEQSPEWNVKKTAIVILSYNLGEYTKQCIASIRENNAPSSFELIVVDNHSTDGIQEWLKEQKDMKLICNSENKGFPYGCNQGIKAASPDADIFLLNNDTIVMPNSLFWLRMGLYEKEKVGACGSVSNYVGNYQIVPETFGTLEEYRQFAIRNNIPKKNPYEDKIFLVGFALLIKRQALDEIGLLDVRFTPGTYEDNDMGIRLHVAGYRVLLCTNSFIFHFGSGAGTNTEKWNGLVETNREKLKNKWGFDTGYYTFARIELIGFIDKPKEEKFSVLEIGCGMGATLAKIKYLWPNAEVKGIELVEKVADIGASYLDIIQGNAEHMEMPYEEKSFDYIILGDVLEHLYNPQELIQKMCRYLKDDGAFLCSIPNMMHVSVLLPLLKGEFEYQESGILDRTHIRFFTLKSILQMFRNCGLKMENLSGTCDGTENEYEAEIEEIQSLGIPNIASEVQFKTYQYIFAARKI